MVMMSLYVRTPVCPSNEERHYDQKVFTTKVILRYYYYYKQPYRGYTITHRYYFTIRYYYKVLLYTKVLLSTIRKRTTKKYYYQVCIHNKKSCVCKDNKKDNYATVTAHTS